MSFIYFDFPSIRRIALICRSKFHGTHPSRYRVVLACFRVPHTRCAASLELCLVSLSMGKNHPGDLDHPRSTKIQVISPPQRWSTMASPSSDSVRRLGKANNMWLRRVGMSLVYPCIAQLEITNHMTMMPLAENYSSNEHLHITLIVLVNL